MIEQMSLRRQILMHHKSLFDAREPRIQLWRELNDYILPRRLRYLWGDSKKVQLSSKIINGTAPRAVGVLSSGMMAGFSSPSRPWIRLMTDPAIYKIPRVATWLALATRFTLDTFARSNIYRCLPKFYRDMAVFGTAAMYLEPDPQDLIRGFVLPLGQYGVANDARGRVNTVSREFDMTVMQLIEKFGFKAVSERTRECYKRKLYTEAVRVVHFVGPRLTRDPERRDFLNMPWRSVWLEKEGNDLDPVLRESGYKRFPYVVARWEVADDIEDAYGDGPGTDAKGDAIAIQHLERRKAQAVDKIVTPPMVGPSGLRPGNMSLIPGGLTTVDVMQGGQQFKPSVDINHLAPKSIREEIAEHADRLNKIFMADLWLMLASSDRREITAREVDERHEEKMYQLGPVVDRLNDEGVEPMVEMTINEGIEQKKLPPPPPELREAGVKVDNISIMGQAQKLVGTVGLERLAGFVGNLAAVDAKILDNLDRDAVVRNYAEMLGVDPTNLTDAEKLAAIRSEKAQAEQAQAMGAAAQPLKQGADAAKVMSETDLRGDSVLSRLMGAQGSGAL